MFLVIALAAFALPVVPTLQVREPTALVTADESSVGAPRLLQVGALRPTVKSPRAPTPSTTMLGLPLGPPAVGLGSAPGGVLDTGPQLGGVTTGPGRPAFKPSPEPGPDCNGNGINDLFEIWQGTVLDCQGDGIPDECQLDTALTYLYDDGIMNVAVTWPHDHLAWLSRHVVQVGHEVVTEVEVAWGLVLPGTPATVALWSDPNGDGDPTDAVLLAELPTTTSLEFTGTLVSLDVPDTFVGPPGASFFVGVYGTFDQSTFPIGLDDSFASLESYVVASDTPIQPDDLLGGAVAVAGAVTNGDWMLRAVSCPGGHCGESIDIDYSGAPDECETQDCNGNLVPDDQDIAQGTSEDCNTDGVPDECQVATGVAYTDADSFSGAIGTNHDHYAWLTRAVIQPGFETITEIELAYGATEAATPVTVGLWSDPDADGNPADAQLLVSVDTLSSLELSGQFVRVNIPDTTVGPAGTSFFVGALGEFDQTWFAAGFDVTSPDQTSWFISADTPLDPDDLATGAAEYGLINQVCACDGDWTIRAVACPTGHCGESQDLNANGIPDECDPDCNGNGVPDDLDIQAGTATDCNSNGIPDSCDALTDCDANGLADLCQATTAMGLVGEYYANVALLGAPLSRIDAEVAFDFDTDPPFPGSIPTDNFSVRWTGAALTTVGGTYTFGVLHDDGVRLWVNGSLLIDEWHPSGGDLDTATIDLPGSTQVYLRLEYYEGNGGALVELQWQPPGGVLLPMLPSDLSPIYDKNLDGIPDGCQVPDCNGNGVDDLEDILFGTSFDLDADGTPDECEPCEDCDGNHYPDAVEAGAGPGLIGQYYAATGNPRVFTSWYATRVDPTVDFDWGVLGPSVVPTTDDFGVRWTGTLTTPSASGGYTFHVSSDDGVRLWLDGALLVDEWHPSAGTEYQAVVNLSGDSQHLLRLDYYEGGGDALVHLEWTVPGAAKVTIPSGSLSPHTDLNGDGVPDTCTADCDLDGVIDALEADLDGDCVPDDCQDGAGYWRFEEAGGGIALDDSLNGLDGLLSPLPVRVPDVPVPAVPLTGSPDLQALSLGWQGTAAGGYLTVPDAGGLLGVAGGSFTLEAWVKLDLLGTADNAEQRQWLFMKKAAAGSDALLEYSLLVQSGNLTTLGTGPEGRELMFRYGDGAQVHNVASVFTIEDLDWHFVSVAYDAPRRELRFGLDGAFETVALDKPVLANSGPLLIGAHENQSGVKNQFVRGTVDEVRFTRVFLPPQLLLDHDR